MASARPSSALAGLAVAGLIAGCAPRSSPGGPSGPSGPGGPGGPSWIDRDDPSAIHAARTTPSEAAPAGPDRDRPADRPDASAASPTRPVHVDIAKLDPARADDYDEPTVLAALDALGALGALGDRAPAGVLALRAARLAHHRGDDRAAQALIARAGHAGDAATVRAALAALAAELVVVTVDPKLVAVLLPLSGPYAAIGSELRIAIELAPAAGTRWWFVDTRGTPEGAAAAVEAAAVKGAIGVLGPVGQREAVAAARAAALAGLPIALLAPGDGADPAAGVFRVVSSTAGEGRAVARLAAQDNFPTVAVLAPRDDVGRDAADAFVEEATRLGLQVMARGTYDPTGGDVEPDIKAFLGLVPAHNPRLAAHLARHGKAGWTTFSPDIPYTLLYVPDRYDRAAIVAAFLPYYNVELRTGESTDPDRLARKHGGHIPQLVQLVGGAGWHHPTLPVRGGAAVQGALIVDDFAGPLGGDAAVQLAEAFAQRAHRPPSTAAAQAHDAAALIAAARSEAVVASPAAVPSGAAASRDPRRALRAALAHARLADGACGPAAIGPDGELDRVPSVLEVQGDELILSP